MSKHLYENLGRGKSVHMREKTLMRVGHLEAWCVCGWKGVSIRTPNRTNDTLNILKTMSDKYDKYYGHIGQPVGVAEKQS